MSQLYISYLGWNSNYQQGQFRVSDESLKKFVLKTNAWLQSESAPQKTIDEEFVIKEINQNNLHSLIPVVNIIYGLGSMYKSIFYSDAELIVIKKHIVACRLLLFITGLLEITWIGAVIIHGLASLYFHIFKGLTDPNLITE